MSTVDLLVSITMFIAVVILIAYAVAMIDMHFMYKRINKERQQQRIIEALKRK